MPRVREAKSRLRVIAHNHSRSCAMMHDRTLPYIIMRDGARLRAPSRDSLDCSGSIVIFVQYKPSQTSLHSSTNLTSRPSSSSTRYPRPCSIGSSRSDCPRSGRPHSHTAPYRRELVYKSSSPCSGLAYPAAPGIGRRAYSRKLEPTFLSPMKSRLKHSLNPTSHTDHAQGAGREAHQVEMHVGYDCTAKTSLRRRIEMATARYRIGGAESETHE